MTDLFAEKKRKVAAGDSGSGSGSSNSTDGAPATLSFTLGPPSLRLFVSHDLFAHCLDFLSVRDVCAALRVCREWCQLTPPRLKYSEVHVPSAAMRDINALLAFVKPRAPYAQRLHIEDAACAVNVTWLLAELSHPATRVLYPSLRLLSLKGCRFVEPVASLPALLAARTAPRDGSQQLLSVAMAPVEGREAFLQLKPEHAFRINGVQAAPGHTAGAAPLLEANCVICCRFLDARTHPIACAHFSCRVGLCALVCLPMPSA